MTPTEPTELQQAVARVRLCRSQGPDAAYPDAQPGEYIRDCDEIVDAFLALLDAGELVRVRGLEWVPLPGFGNDEETANTVFGMVSVRRAPSQSDERCAWVVYGSEYQFNWCESIQDGKAKATEWYRSRLAAALEPLLPEAL